MQCGRVGSRPLLKREPPVIYLAGGSCFYGTSVQAMLKARWLSWAVTAPSILAVGRHVSDGLVEVAFVFTICIGCDGAVLLGLLPHYYII